MENPGDGHTKLLVARDHQFVFNYVDGCNKCQQYKNFPQPHAGRLMPIGTPVEPWKAILVDFIVGLPEAQGHDALLVVVD